MILLSSVLAVALTGCVVDPWDEGYRGHHDRNGHYDRDRGDKDWKNIKIIVTGNVIEAIGTGAVIVNRYLPFIKRIPLRSPFYLGIEYK